MSIHVAAPVRPQKLIPNGTSWTIGAAVGITLATLTILLVAYGQMPIITQFTGLQDSLVFRGFYKLESLQGVTYRWSTRNSTLFLPQVGLPAAGWLSLQTRVPSAHGIIPVLLSTGGGPLVMLPIQGQRTVSLLVARSNLGAGDLRLGLRSPTMRISGDPRQIGIGIARLTWQGLPWTLPPIRQVVVLAALVPLLLTFLLRLRWPPWIATSTVGLLTGILAATAGLRPLMVAPYTHRLLLIVLLAHSGLALWAMVLRADQRLWTLPHHVTPIALLLLLGIGYWMMWPYQQALCAETVVAVCPPIDTGWIGAIGLGLMLAVGLLPAWSSRRPTAALGVLMGCGIIKGVYHARSLLNPGGNDFLIHWHAAYNFAPGRPLYNLSALHTNHFGTAYKLPPFYITLLLPLTHLGELASLQVFRLVNVALYIAIATLLVRLLRPHVGRLCALATICLVLGLMQPPFDTIAYGQVDILLLGALLIALVGLRKQYPAVSGLAIAFATLIKLYPLLFVGFLVVQRQWKAILWTVLGLALLNGFSIVVLGWQPHIVYMTRVLPIIGGGTSWIENQTINGFLSRLVTGDVQLPPLHNRLVDILTYSSFCLITGLSLLVAARQSDRRSSTYALQASLLYVVMVMSIPAAWIHYETIVLLTFVFLVWHADQHHFTIGQAVMIAFAFALIGYGNQWSFFVREIHLGLPLLALSYKGYGLVLLWCTLMTILRQSGTSTPPVAQHSMQLCAVSTPVLRC